MKLIFSFEEFQMFIMLIFVPESGFERLGFGPSAFISIFATTANGAVSQSEIYTVFCVALGDAFEANFLDLYHVEFADEGRLGTNAEEPLDSPNVNSWYNIERPISARDGMPVTKEHDLVVVAQMFK
jgi:hypothetical protein